MKHRNSLESYELTRIGDKIMTERTKKAFCPAVSGVLCN